MKPIAFFICGLLAGFICAVAFSNFAVEAYAEAGQCKFQRGQDGVFYQADRGVNMDLAPDCGTIGLRGKSSSLPRWGWKVGLLATSSFRGDNIATLHDSEMGRFDLVCDRTYGTPNHGCLQRHQGTGDIRGLQAGFTYSLISKGRFSLDVGGGLFYFSSRYKNHPSHVDCAGCWQHPDYQSGSKTDFIRKTPAAYVGVAVRYGPLFVSVEQFEPLGNGYESITDFRFQKRTLGLAWEF